MLLSLGNPIILIPHLFSGRYSLIRETICIWLIQKREKKSDLISSLYFSLAIFWFVIFFEIAVPRSFYWLLYKFYKFEFSKAACNLFPLQFTNFDIYSPFFPSASMLAEEMRQKSLNECLVAYEHIVIWPNGRAHIYAFAEIKWDNEPE